MWSLTVYASIIVVTVVLPFSLSKCPKNFTDVGSKVCLIVIKQPSFYCDAHRICDQEGRNSGQRLFMIGRHAHKLSVNLFGLTIFHTGINSFLENLGKLRNGWQVSEPGYISDVLNATDIPWSLLEPFENGEQVVSFLSGGLYAKRQSSLFTYPVCELSNVAYPNKTGVSKFNRNYPRPLASNFMELDLSVGCFRQTTAASALACGLKCRLLDECFTFYFNQQRKDCRLSLYVDSRLPKSLQNTPGEWMRFRRKP
ncbi:hypothetical protein EG68_04964 [Paragonimus skrjabini miyazakii]|uniref:Apple domain-containing protein n=1 Tax=Paragonimus skrjabini miyazakii TaxID=59628 RepID=A0A8S9YYB3_9TREM|nr:hypothetical protein EG68_04964 [Paragonimus skrjabini miyazakii]